MNANTDIMDFNKQRTGLAAIKKLFCSILLLPAAILMSCQWAFAGNEPAALFLTWQQDPTTTMTVDWHTLPDDKADPALRYKLLGTSEWVKINAEPKEFPHSDRTIHRVELTGLNPASYYRFRVGEFGREYKFRTMPDNLSEPLRFITGGDTHHERHEMSAQAMKHDPDFILWGGDLAYANADPARVELWYGWFDGIRENLISDEGRVVPIVVAIGNHEVFGIRRLLSGGSPHEEHTEEEAKAYMKKYNLWENKPTFFSDLFAFPGEPAYNVLDFSNYMSIVILDTNHGSPIEGEQTDWLTEVLAERDGRPHIFPVYHWPAYPSHRPYDGSVPRRIRENWVPLFEEHGVRVVFENHDHTYKRTYPIRNDEIHPNGLVYIGDGNWGRSTSRDGNSRDEWYIDQFVGQTQHGIIVTLHGPHQHFLMVDADGNIIDEYPRTPFSPTAR